jgi:dimethylglycine dehydrogenase
MRSQARVVIIGGGMMGAGLLYHLAEEGWTDSMLIEKGELTSGSTWHAAGQCPSVAGSYNLAKIHNYGVDLYPKLEAITGQYVSWHACGGIRLAYTDEEVDWFRHVMGTRDLIPFDVEVIGPNEIKNLLPHIDVTGVKAGVWTKNDGHIDPAGGCNALAAGAKQMGAEIVRHTRVTDVRALPSGEWEVVTENGNVTCEHVVNAAGCYARKVAEWVGADVPITNMLHQYFVTEPIKEFIESDIEMPVIRDPAASAYYRQEQKSGLIGIYETAPEWAEEAWAARGGFPEWESENELFDGSFDKSMVHLEQVLNRMPIWAESGIKRIVHGAIPHTPDANPLLGPTAGVKNFWMCNGASIGIAQGAGAGKYLAQWMIHGAAEINMAEFDPRRFGDWTTEDYVREKSFEDYNRMYACPLPGEELDTGRPKRTTPLYEKLKSKGCVYTAAFGWERPKWFSLDGREEHYAYRRNNTFEVVAEECKAVRERVGILDLSSFAKFDVSGDDAENFLNRICANRMPKRDGGIVLAHVLTDQGRIENEFTITRLAENHFYLLSAAVAELRDFDFLNQRQQPDESVTVKNITDDYGVLVLAGPKSRDVLSQLTSSDLSNESFKWLSGQTIAVAGISLRALRLNYVGELGWELHVEMDKLEEIYDAVWAAGEAHGIADFGVYAVNSLRMEKAYKGFGVELTNEITMVEADMERFVYFDKGDFTGRQATLERRSAELELKLIYAEVDADDTDARGGECLYDKGRAIGISTSGGFGHASGKSLVFAYVEPAFADPGCTIDIEILGDLRTATVLADPIWDAANDRLRG